MKNKTTTYRHKQKTNINEIAKIDELFYILLELTKIPIHIACLSLLGYVLLSYMHMSAIYFIPTVAILVFVFFSLAQLYSIIIDRYIDTLKSINNETQDGKLIQKHQKKFKRNQHLKNSETRYIKNNMVRYRERNNRTMRRIINIRSEKK